MLKETVVNMPKFWCKMPKILCSNALFSVKSPVSKGLIHVLFILVIYSCIFE